MAPEIAAPNRDARVALGVVRLILCIVIVLFENTKRAFFVHVCRSYTALPILAPWADGKRVATGLPHHDRVGRNVHHHEVEHADRRSKQLTTMTSSDMWTTTHCSAGARAEIAMD